MKNIRKKIYEIIEPCDGNGRISLIYDFFIMITVVISLVPLAFKETTTTFYFIDRVTVAIFIIDYLLRFITADLKLKKSAISFLLYPFTPMAIIDILAILPSLTILNKGFRLLRLFRLLRTLKVFRLFKFFRYSKSFEALVNVFRKQKDMLSAVGTLSVAYVLVSALVVYNIEPDIFNSFFDAIYWAVVSLTTVGYGDIYPVTTLGRFVTMLSSIFGIAIIALPSGVITAGYLSELTNDKKDSQNDSENKCE